MKRGQRKRHLSQAMVFLILFGIVSLFSDMTHEGGLQHPGSLFVHHGRFCWRDRIFLRIRRADRLFHALSVWKADR